ncbi:MAG TPA: CDP-alcohol phosphatidyltransferase [Bacteroidales bacterium]|jgi:phosphatidylglycerophosphate synthase|nr:CDP-alcohol phosphatidyltransferase family protein [Bacteroidales bacterium]MDI9532602.1 CDP-alcohol phosphatidyltransferase [Bacteroidota bacterium]MBP8708991.1 CDP-alcohol phosphatidyltransferase family protein [Bacteroidales bacterium]HOC49036.1 CDP-alcohol phosphatidyltransferase [Bacteroidales bacterium]HPV17397.1 CDP-alcohol phosphatidyltransferase [Bacteroidales bacterium]
MTTRNNLKSLFNGEVLRNVFSDRPRTNLLKRQEEMAISWLVQRIPAFITSNMLTGIGFFGNMIVCGSFILASFFNRNFLLLGLLGFAVSWFGDSLDGRLAYYRNKPRKKYGFTLDITIDWISIILIGLGYIVYAEGTWKLLGYGFVVLYGWEIIIALIRFSITGRYSIDSGKVGPTEVRIIIGLIMIAEVLFPGSLNYSAFVVVIALFFVNILDTRQLLRVADNIDKKEAKEKT